MTLILSSLPMIDQGVLILERVLQTLGGFGIDSTILILPCQVRSMETWSNLKQKPKFF